MSQQDLKSLTKNIWHTKINYRNDILNILKKNIM